MKPILFTKENRAATRSGTKTQTRRVITDNLPARARFDGHKDGSRWWEEVDEKGNPTEEYFEWRAPYVVGEIRYVREPYQVTSTCYNKGRQVIGEYLDDGKPFDVVLIPDEWDLFLARKYPYSSTQARFMYKSLARTFVEITDLHREPLQEISEADCALELGVPVKWEGEGPEPYKRDLRGGYRTLWDSINAARGHGWDTNPTVLVVEYKLVTP